MNMQRMNELCTYATCKCGRDLNTHGTDKGQRCNRDKKSKRKRKRRCQQGSKKGKPLEPLGGAGKRGGADTQGAKMGSVNMGATDTGDTGGVGMQGAGTQGTGAQGADTPGAALQNAQGAANLIINSRVQGEEAEASKSEDSEPTLLFV